MMASKTKATTKSPAKPKPKAKAKAKAKSSRDTVLFIHGMWGNGAQWRGWQEIFEAKGYATLAPSLRHHDVDPRGIAPAQLGSVSLLDYVADLEAEIAKLPGKPIIIGHSMGALIAQILVSRGQAKASIFVTPAPPAGLPAIIETMMPSVLVALMGKSLTAGMTDRPHRISFGQAAYSCLNNLPRARQEEEYAKWVWESGRVLFEITNWFLNRSRASWVDPKLVNVPTLTIACALDRITPKPVVARIAARYRARGGDYRVYDEHAHFIIAEEGWEAFAEDCAAWIETAVGAKAEN